MSFPEASQEENPPLRPSQSHHHSPPGPPYHPITSPKSDRQGGQERVNREIRGSNWQGRRGGEKAVIGWFLFGVGWMGGDSPSPRPTSQWLPCLFGSNCSRC